MQQAAGCLGTHRHFSESQLYIWRRQARAARLRAQAQSSRWISTRSGFSPSHYLSSRAFVRSSASLARARRSRSQAASSMRWKSVRTCWTRRARARATERASMRVRTVWTRRKSRSEAQWCHTTTAVSPMKMRWKTRRGAKSSSGCDASGRPAHAGPPAACKTTSSAPRSALRGAETWRSSSRPTRTRCSHRALPTWRWARILAPSGC